MSKNQNNYDWLPELMLLDDYDNDFKKYEEAVYKAYENDFLKNILTFLNMPVKIKKTPFQHGKHASFWHIVNERDSVLTNNESERIPNLRRYERIRWTPAILKNFNNNKNLFNVWKNERKGNFNILIWAYEIDYLVILRKKEKCLLLWTAYPIDYEHTKRKLLKEFEEFKKSGDAL